MSSKPSNEWTEVKSRKTKNRQKKDAKREKWMEREQASLGVSMDDVEAIPPDECSDRVYNCLRQMATVINKQGDLIEGLQETIKNLRRDVAQVRRAAAVEAREQFPPLE